MTQSTPERAPCAVCGKECSVNADGTIRHHLTDNPEFQAGPDSRKCKGAGQPPATPAGVALAEDMESPTTGGSQCRLCKHPVELSSNGRARSHLTLEATPRPCPAGSDFPLGTYPDIVGTTDGLVASLAVDCGHVPAGQCYGCYGATGNPVSDGELDAMAEAQGRGEAPWGVAPGDAAQPTMADQLKAIEGEPSERGRWQALNTEWIRQREDDTRDEAARFMDAAPATHTGRPSMHSGTVSPDPHAYEATVAIAAVKAEAAEQDRQHAEILADVRRRAYPDGVYCPKCDTDNHRCPGCGTDVRHGVVACDDCERELLARKLPAGRTEDGRRCEHHEAVFGVENDRLVCVACGTPCTHPDGFTENDPVEDDGEGLVFRCALCGAVDSEVAEETHVVTDDSDDPEHVDDCPGCPTDRKAGETGPDPADAWRTPDDLMARMPEKIRGLDALRLDCLACGHPVTPLADRFDIYGDVEAVVWMCREEPLSGHHKCRDHECAPDTRVRLGDLDEGDYFVRRGALMRLTERESSTSVLAVVVGGPYDGRTGELKNLDETVERAPEPRSTEQETKECTDETMPQQRLASSATSSTRTTTPTAPAPGSPQGTKAPVPAVSPKSESVTSSAPTARVAGRGGSAAVTTDQADAAARFLGGGGRPAAPATTGTQDQAAAAAQFLAGGSGAHGEKETKRDRFGRYLIPHPDTGKEQAWTRSTTFAKSISDTYALSQWGLRMALIGATMRPDIVKRAHGKHVRADKKLLDELTAELKTAAGDKVAANLGTSMHSFTEMADRAWHSPGGPRSILDQVPPDCRDDVETYIRLLEETGLEPVPHLIEFTTVVKQYGVAGTSDNCYKVTKPLTLKIGRAEVRFEPGDYTIGDKKTGRDLDYGWQEIAIQLGTYAQGINTSGVWDRHEEKWRPDPLDGAKVRTDAGIVIHLPVDKESEKTPTVYGIDLESGWNAAVLCERVRAWRKVRNLASPVMVSEADTFAPSRPQPEAVVSRTTVRPPTLKEKANAVTSKGEASAVWQAATDAGLPQAEVDRLVDIMQARLRELDEPGG